MYLKALEIQGFKSFPDKVRLTFEKDFTAIVGPNGSGKSNISDALLWVMGEQSSKALRGSKMEDVIFSGTEDRSPMGFAQVSLFFDNSSRLFDLDSSEVMLTRRCYRSGESEYYINKESVRLKDIRELLMDTGLGRDGYSIIGQGHIADIVSAKSAERREVFEEAAGITRFRYRKEDAQRRLAKTEDNLLRINDKIEELEIQIAPLEKQAETAKRYLILRDELRLLEVSVWMDTLDRLAVRLQALDEQYTAARAELDEAHAGIDGLYARAEQLSERMREKDLEAEELRTLLTAAESAAAECESAAAVLQANLHNNAESIDRLRREADEQADRTRGIQSQQTQRRARIDAIAAEKADLQLQEAQALRSLDENDAETAAERQKLADVTAQQAHNAAAQSQAHTTLVMLAEAAQELEDREAGCLREWNESRQRRGEAQTALNDADAALGRAREDAVSCANAMAGHRMLIDLKKKNADRLAEQHTTLTIELKNTDSRVHMLAEMEKDYEGYSKAVKTVMREKGRGTLRGIHAPVANLVKADDRCALAIETALGGAMQNIVVDTQRDGKAAIELLKARDAGRSTFLPLDVTAGSRLDRPPLGEDGYIGIAAELIDYDARYDGIFLNLLGRTAVVETLSDAVRIAGKYKNRFRIVTLDGQQINAGGSMTGGSASRSAGILSRSNELARLREQRAALDAKLEDCARRLHTAQLEYDTAQANAANAAEALAEANNTVTRCEGTAAGCRQVLESIERVMESLQEEKASLAAKREENRSRIADTRAAIRELEQTDALLLEEIRTRTAGSEAFETRRRELAEALSALRTAAATLDAERETLLASMAQTDELLQAMTGDSAQRQAGLEALESKNLAAGEELAQKQARLAELNQRTDELRTRISGVTQARLELEGERTRAEKAAQDSNRALLEQERSCAQLEQEKVSADMEEKQMLDKLWDSYELTRTAAQQVRQELESVPKANRRLGELRREINSLGTPNLGAIEEFERVSTRRDFLTDQRDDVEHSKTELLRIIGDITREMRTIFLREFSAVNEAFSATFRDLFGGGKAALELEDEENVLECGIEIRVQPPGKTLTSLSLLSGGEKSFVAICLYFAILKVRPAPFCIMDEIEAALDDANVTRFAEYLRTLCARTQFLVITHRRGTMEEADLLYGVTMQEKGVSRVLELDLAAAEKTIV